MNRLLGSITLIAGTAIGAGMLALPVATAMIGFWPSALIFLLVAACMIYVGFLIVEVLTVLPKNATMISMASDNMGVWGKRAVSISYFFLIIALNVAYLAGSSQLLLAAFGFNATSAASLIITSCLALVCAGFASSSTEKIDRANRLLFLALCGCYGAMLFGVTPYVKLSLLNHLNWRGDIYSLISPLALILTSFGYHIIIPNIFDYLDRDIKQTKLAISIGTLIPLVVYLLWQLMVLGSVPLEGPQGLILTLQKGLPATQPLAANLNLIWLGPLAGAFALFAILTSFLGTMMALCEFIIDALNWNSDPQAKPKAALLAAVLLIAISLSGSRLFVSALEYAGIWTAILIGCLPILMAALARHRYRFQQRPYLVKGGFAVMSLAFIAFAAVACFETIKHLS
jgi:tyrosine-specific transport protein